MRGRLNYIELRVVTQRTYGQREASANLQYDLLVTFDFEKSSPFEITIPPTPRAFWHVRVDHIYLPHVFSRGTTCCLSLSYSLFPSFGSYNLSLSLFLCRTWTRCSRFLDAPAFRQNMRPVETTLYNIMADTYRYAFLSDKSRTSRGNVRNFGANARSSRRGSSMVATRPRADLYLLVNVYVSCIFISSEILICNCSFSKTRNRYL